MSRSRSPITPWCVYTSYRDNRFVFPTLKILNFYRSTLTKLIVMLMWTANILLFLLCHPTLSLVSKYIIYLFFLEAQWKDKFWQFNCFLGNSAVGSNTLFCCLCLALIVLLLVYTPLTPMADLVFCESLVSAPIKWSMILFCNYWLLWLWT